MKRKDYVDSGGFMISEFAVYQGKEYDATILSDSVWLRSTSNEDLNKGFTFEDGVYYKNVPLSDIDSAYHVIKYAIIDGVSHTILGETEHEITVSFDFVSDDTAQYYGLHEAYGKGMYSKTFPKSGIEFEIEREEYDLKNKKWIRNK